MLTEKQTYKFILSGGGTGGHIYPAIAIADALKLRFPDAKFLFVGAKDRMEMEKVPLAGYAIKGLWISGIQRKLSFKNLMFPFKLISSLWKSHQIIKQFKPDIAIGTGGFASGPLLQMASSKGIPSLIQEQNSYPGITNKLLAKKVNTICVAYEGLEAFFPEQKIKFTGNPIRKNLLNTSISNTEAKRSFGLNPEKQTLLVIGGSLGAQKINELIASHIQFLDTLNIEVIWQCGKLYHNTCSVYNKHSNIQVHAFLNTMASAYAAADIIISRAGAISVSELCVVGKPVIFIPSPNVAEDHQTKNAEAIASKNAAILIKEKDLAQIFITEFTALIHNKTKQEELQKNIKSLAMLDATDAIANEVEKLLENNNH